MRENTILNFIGKTPLVKLQRFGSDKNANLYAKLESFNPGSSVKDRVALSMINTAEENGLLQFGQIIIEPTSGNTGIGLALVCAVKGYKLILTMPETMSIERRKLLVAYGAEIILTPGSKGMQGAVDKAKELLNLNENYFMPSQFTNLANPTIHYKTTAQELWDSSNGEMDIFVAAIGTGGTVSGVGKFLKEKKPEIKIIGVEPAESPLLSSGHAGPHKIQGIGANFIPQTLDKSILDEILVVKGSDAIETSRILAKTEGILCGISSGANAYIALEIASRPENKGKNIYFIICDTGERYLSTELFSYPE